MANLMPLVHQARRTVRNREEGTRTREVGPNRTGAKGSSTVYRIVEPA